MSSRYHQGKYRCQYPEKYVGDPTGIIFRSKWEYDFFRYCDHHPSVKKWGSEEMCLEYINPIDNTKHRYFPDLIVEVENKVGALVKLMIEIKPYSQTLPPTKPKKLTRNYAEAVATYIINQAKWEAADQFCKTNGMDFKVITENEIYKKKG